MGKNQKTKSKKSLSAETRIQLVSTILGLIAALISLVASVLALMAIR